jgi:hypothetical protein
LALYLAVFAVSGPARGMAARLQLQVPTCRLLEQSCGSESKHHTHHNHLIAKKKRKTHVSIVYWYYRFLSLSVSLYGSHTLTSTCGHGTRINLLKPSGFFTYHHV